MMPSFEELEKLADKVTTFRQWLNLAMIEADRYTLDAEINVDKILGSWHIVMGRPKVEVMKAYLDGTQKVPGDFIGDIWGVWKADIDPDYTTKHAQTRAVVVVKAWDRIRDIDDEDVLVPGNLPSNIFRKVSPSRAVMEDEIKDLGFAIGGMLDFNAQYELIHKFRLEINDYIFGKNRRGE